MEPTTDAEVRAAVANEPPLFIDTLFGYARAELVATTAGLRRTIFLMVILVGVHELLLRAAIRGASVGGFQITDLSLPRKIAPALLAFLFYEFAGYVLAMEQLERFCASLIRVGHPAIWTNRLLPRIVPANPALVGLTPQSKHHLLDKIAEIFQGLLVLVLLCAPIFYGLRAIRLEFRRFGFSPEALLAAIVAGAFLLYAGVLLAIAFVSVEGGHSLVPPRKDSGR